MPPPGTRVEPEGAWPIRAISVRRGYPSQRRGRSSSESINASRCACTRDGTSPPSSSSPSSMFFVKAYSVRFALETSNRAPSATAHFAWSEARLPLPVSGRNSAGHVYRDGRGLPDGQLLTPAPRMGGLGSRSITVTWLAQPQIFGIRSTSCQAPPAGG